MVAVVRRQFLGDAVDPFVEQSLWPGIECRKTADDPRLALGDHQIGAGHDEQGRADYGQAETGQDRWRGHE